MLIFPGGVDDSMVEVERGPRGNVYFLTNIMVNLFSKIIYMNE